MVAAAAGWFPDRDAVADGEFLGSDEDVLDDGARHALAVLGGGGGRAGAQPGEEALEVAGEPEVGVAVGGLGVEGGDLVLQAGLAGAQGGRAGAELVDGDELCSENAVTIAAIDPAALARAWASWPRLRVTGSEVQARWSLLSISARMRAGPASRAVTWSQTTWSA